MPKTFTREEISTIDKALNVYVKDLEEKPQWDTKNELRIVKDLRIKARTYFDRKRVTT